MNRHARTVLRLFAGPWLVWCALSGSAAAQQTHMLVITGVAGDEEHAKKFNQWATTFIETAKSKEGVPADNIV